MTRRRAAETDEERTASLADNTGRETRRRAEETGTHVRARESEGTACVFVSGSRFESFFFLLFFGLHILPRTSGHARTGTYKHVLVQSMSPLSLCTF